MIKENQTKNWTIIWIAVVAVIAIVAAFNINAITGNIIFEKQNEEVIKIGHISPLTGNIAAFGEYFKDGIELAVDEINTKGGINGREIIVVHEDSQGDPKTGITAINKLITLDKVSAVIGAAASSVTLACAPIAEENKVILLSPGSADTKISEAGDYIFRIFPSTAQERKKLVKVAKDLDYNKGAILYINNDFGFGLSEAIQVESAEKSIEIVSSETYQAEAKDFRTQLIKIKGKDPQVIFLSGYNTDMALILKQAKELGLNVQFLAPDTFNVPEILELAADAAEGVIFTIPNEEVPESFEAKFMAKYNKEPNVFHALAYDSLNMIALAIENEGYSGEEIKDGLYKISDFPGITGDISFDKNGDAIDRPLVLKTVKNGKFIEYEK